MYEKEIEVAKKAAVEAGAVVMDIRRKGAGVEWKGENDPVTEADRAASSFVIELLKKDFPDDGILSEEEKDDLTRLEKERVWIIDPLDGTKEFVDGLDHFTVMVGLAIDGKAVLGAVYRPMADDLFYAAPGIGAWEEKDGERVSLKVSGPVELSGTRFLASRSHLSPLVKKATDEMGVHTEPMRLGSVGYKVSILSTAKADLYMHLGPGIKEWDSCAPEAILRVSGGMITDPFGEPLRYNQKNVKYASGIIASSGGPVHEAAVKAASAVLSD